MPLRIGIIGAGGIAAKMHLPELLPLADRAKVTLVAGRTERRLKRLCEAFDIPRYVTKYEDVIADKDIDAVIIATPHMDHVKWGIAALEAGKHVYMQKPLSGDLAEAEAFVAAAEKHSSRITYCLPHFDDTVQSLRAMLKRGDLGKPTAMRARTSHGGPEIYYREVASFFGEPEPKELWFFDEKKAGVGALFDMGVYATSYTVAILGSIRRVTAVIATVEKPTTLEDAATLILESESGAIGTAETSWCDPGRTWEFSLHGSTGKITWGANQPVRLHRPTALDRDNAPIDVKDLQVSSEVGNSHKHWLDCIDRRQPPPINTARTARHITEVLLAGLQSGKTGKPVEVKSRLA